MAADKRFTGVFGLKYKPSNIFMQELQTGDGWLCSVPLGLAAVMVEHPSMRTAPMAFGDWLRCAADANA